MFLTVLVSAIYIYTALRLFRERELSSTYPIIKISSIIVVVLFGVFYFQEKLNAAKICGMLLGLVSLYLLS